MKIAEIIQMSKSKPSQAVMKVVKQYGSTILSNRDRDIFLAALRADGKPDAALRKAAVRYKAIRRP